MIDTTHLVQFFRDEDRLITAVGRYLCEGLAAGHTCVVVATAAHHARFDAQMFEAGLNPGALTAEYRYIPLNAEQMLTTFFSERGGLDHDRFHHQFGLLMSQAAARGQPIRIFGEMVTLLAERGRPEVGIELEELWNELSRQHLFSLFCAYHASEFTENPRYRKLLHSVHSHVVREEV